MMSRQPLGATEGRTQASNVIPVDRCSAAASAIVTREVVPLNTSALPYLPLVVHVAFVMAPLCPLPDTSASVAPVPSLNAYAATSPELAAVIVVGSDAELLAPFASPPPLTVAVFVTLAGAVLATVTVTVTAG